MYLVSFLIAIAGIIISSGENPVLGFIGGFMIGLALYVAYQAGRNEA